MFRSRVILENERGQYISTAPFLFLRVPLLRKQTVPRRTPLGSVGIAEGFLFLSRDGIAQVVFWILFLRVACRDKLRAFVDGSFFRIPVGGKWWAQWWVVLFFRVACRVKLRLFFLFGWFVLDYSSYRRDSCAVINARRNSLLTRCFRGFIYFLCSGHFLFISF